MSITAAQARAKACNSDDKDYEQAVGQVFAAIERAANNGQNSVVVGEYLSGNVLYRLKHLLTNQTYNFNVTPNSWTTTGLGRSTTFGRPSGPRRSVMG